MSKKDLLNAALELTKSNVVKATSRISMNDRILKHLQEEPMTRIELVNIITIERLEEQGEAVTVKLFKNEEFLAKFAKMNKTVKNGVDTSLSKSNNNSSFHYNKKYEKYQLDRNEDGKYFITEVGVES